MIRYTVVKNGIKKNSWTSDFAGADYYEENWGKKAWTENVPAVLDPDTHEEISPAHTVDHPAEYEILEEDVTAEMALKERIESLDASGASDEAVCKKCLHIVGGMNKERNLSTVQIQSMASTFASIDFCLAKFMPKSAKVLIEAITPDEAIVTSELKQLLLEVLKEY